MNFFMYGYDIFEYMYRVIIGSFYILVLNMS